MKQKLNLALLIAFQFCYLEWPPNNSMFVFQVEYEIFSRTESWISNFTHPIILLGLISQIVLIIGTIFLNLNKKLNTLGVVILGFLVLFFFVVGIMSLNYKIVLSTIPYLFLAILYFKTVKKVDGLK